MAIEVVMPAMEAGQESARLLRWLKAPGDAVAAGEPLMEIETDKATIEIDAPGAGVLGQISAEPGDDVAIGRVIALLMETQSASEAAPASEAPAVPPAPVRASPLARRIAAERGIDLATVTGTGPGGVIQDSDLPAAPVKTAPAPAAADAAAYTVQPLSGPRRVAAERLSRAQPETPCFDLSSTVDASSLLAAIAAARAEGRELTMTGALARLVVLALGAHPQLNARYVDGELRLYREIGLGVAVATDEGLLVPVVADAGRRSAAALQAALSELALRARERRLAPSEMSGGTFTLTNLGMRGVDRFRAIINPPEVAILAVGRATERPAVVAGELAIRPLMELTLTADHRALDGALAAAFLADLRALAQDAGAQLASAPAALEEGA
ncbi:MAG TPA: dihydrolipoamide acetyltransferase family protein [Gaiellales bacterium]